MAFINKFKKAKIADRLKTQFPNWSFRLKVVHHTKIIVTIVRSDVDFITICNDHIKTVDSDRQYDFQSGMEVYGKLERYYGKNQEAIDKMQEVMNSVNLVGDEQDGNYDNSDVMSDYFDVGYYVSIKVGGDTESTKFSYVPPKTKKMKIC